MAELQPKIIKKLKNVLKMKLKNCIRRKKMASKQIHYNIDKLMNIDADFYLIIGEKSNRKEFPS